MNFGNRPGRCVCQSFSAGGMALKREQHVVQRLLRHAAGDHRPAAVAEPAHALGPAVLDRSGRRAWCRTPPGRNPRPRPALRIAGCRDAGCRRRSSPRSRSCRRPRRRSRWPVRRPLREPPSRTAGTSSLRRIAPPPRRCGRPAATRPANPPAIRPPCTVRLATQFTCSSSACTASAQVARIEADGQRVRVVRPRRAGDGQFDPFLLAGREGQFGGVFLDRQAADAHGQPAAQRAGCAGWSDAGAVWGCARAGR